MKKFKGLTDGKCDVYFEAKNLREAIMVYGVFLSKEGRSYINSSIEEIEEDEYSRQHRNHMQYSVSEVEMEEFLSWKFEVYVETPYGRDFLLLENIETLEQLDISIGMSTNDDVEALSKEILFNELGFEQFKIIEVKKVGKRKYYCNYRGKQYVEAYSFEDAFGLLGAYNERLRRKNFEKRKPMRRNNLVEIHPLDEKYNKIVISEEVVANKVEIHKFLHSPITITFA